MGLAWLVLWLAFPYNRLRRGSTTTQRQLAPVMEGVEVPREFRLNPMLLVAVVLVVGLLPGILMLAHGNSDQTLHIPVPVLALLIGSIPGVVLLIYAPHQADEVRLLQGPLPQGLLGVPHR